MSVHSLVRCITLSTAPLPAVCCPTRHHTATAQSVHNKAEMSRNDHSRSLATHHASCDNPTRLSTQLESFSLYCIRTLCRADEYRAATLYTPTSLRLIKLTLSTPSFLNLPSPSQSTPSLPPFHTAHTTQPSRTRRIARCCQPSPPVEEYICGLCDYLAGVDDTDARVVQVVPLAVLEVLGVRRIVPATQPTVCTTHSQVIQRQRRVRQVRILGRACDVLHGMCAGACVRVMEETDSDC